MLCGGGVLMRVHIYILASTPTRIPTLLSFIKINHIRTSPANKVDCAHIPRPSDSQVSAQETHKAVSQG